MEYVQKSKALLKIGGPLIISQLLEYVTFQQALFFNGHLGQNEFAGVGLGVTFITVIGVSVAFGISSASNTLMSQHFGSEDKKQVGLVFQKALWFSIVATVCSASLLLNSEWILRFVAPSEEISILAAQYIKYLLVGLAAFIINLQMQTLLICQGIAWPIPLMYLVINVFIAVFSYLFVFVLHLGVLGNAMAFVLSFFIVDILFAICIVCRGYHVQVWDGWTRSSLADWGTYTKLAIPGILLVFIEWGSFNVCTVLTGLTGPQPLGAQLVIYHTGSISYMFPYGISNAASVLVGNSLGAMDPIGARKTFIATLILSSSLGLLVGGLTSAMHSVIPYLFTSESGIIEKASAAFREFIVMMFFDFVQGSLTGVARGCGKQYMASIAEFVGLTLIATPIGLILLFKTTLGLHGLMLGFTIGLALLALFLVVYFWRLDWHEEAKEAQIRIEGEREAEQEHRRILDESSESTHVASEVSWRTILLETLIKVLLCLILLSSAVCLSIYVRPQYPQNPYSDTLNVTKEHLNSSVNL